MDHIHTNHHTEVICLWKHSRSPLRARSPSSTCGQEKFTFVQRLIPSRTPATRIALRRVANGGCPKFVCMRRIAACCPFD
eukprot:944100-Amphidinium_carterae.1